MKPEPTNDPRVKDFRTLLLRIPQERSVDGVLQVVAQGLASRGDTALARIWLLGEGDLCASCSQAGECRNRESCLHLAASSGSSLHSDETWSRLDGDFRRFPIGIRKVGQIAERGEPLEILDVQKGGTWIARPEWIRREGIRGFIGQPLVFRGNVLGVLAVFLRSVPQPEELSWLRTVADHVAISIVNARAFEEIESLRRRLELENACLREELAGEQDQDAMVGQSAALMTVQRQIELVARTGASVLILGETGVGKELVAREIHRRSSRSDRPMIRVNCASIPRDLFESEFFGHVRGAFTGALRNRAGRLEAANGGTIFLDEVGEIPIDLQGKLLRVLQDGEYERVGEETTRKVDVRVIAATNRDLKHDVEVRHFRSDLYYRLNVFPLEVPALRARKEDIPLLISRFVEQGSRKLGRRGLSVPGSELPKWLAYDWPGNVRELQNAVERAIITSQDGRLRFDLKAPRHEGRPLSEPAETELDIVSEGEKRAWEKRNLEAALARAGGRVYGKGGAAELLGIPPTTLNARLKKFGLKTSARR